MLDRGENASESSALKKKLTDIEILSQINGKTLINEYRGIRRQPCVASLSFPRVVSPRSSVLLLELPSSD